MVRRLAFDLKPPLRELLADGPGISHRIVELHDVLVVVVSNHKSNPLLVLCRADGNGSPILQSRARQAEETHKADDHQRQRSGQQGLAHFSLQKQDNG